MTGLNPGHLLFHVAQYAKFYDIRFKLKTYCSTAVTLPLTAGFLLSVCSTNENIETSQTTSAKTVKPEAAKTQPRLGSEYPTDH